MRLFEQKKEVRMVKKLNLIMGCMMWARDIFVDLKLDSLYCFVMFFIIIMEEISIVSGRAIGIRERFLYFISFRMINNFRLLFVILLIYSYSICIIKMNIVIMNVIMKGGIKFLISKWLIIFIDL